MRTERTSGLTLQSSGPWDNEYDRNQSISLEPVAPMFLIRELELNHSVFSLEILRSISESEWYTIDNGRYFIEVRNPDFNQKLRGAADFIDFDDCLFKSTQWHKKEYELIANSSVLHERNVHISVEQAGELYQQSKITIPNKVEREPRYTPLLNLLLLTDLTQQLETGVDIIQAWQEVLNTKSKAVDIVSRIGESCLNSYKLDQCIVDIFANNSPALFVYDQTAQLIFANPIIMSDFKAIVTRGKIEGPLGQVHKIHASGIINQPVDLVLYTNDRKAEAILLFSRLFPQLKNMCLRAIDDNPNEILPYRDFARSRGIENLKLIHIRHPDAKRHNEVINENEQPSASFRDPESGTIFDHYLPSPHLYAVF